MRRPPLVASAALVVLLAGAALAPVTASPQPTPLCPACGGQFERAAADLGVNVAVGESTALVQVHENGSATWTVRNRLNTTDGFREDPSALDGVAGRAVREQSGPLEDPTFRDAHLDGETAVIVFHDPAAADRHAGLLVADYLHDRGRELLYRVNADRLTIRGPPDTVVTNAPESGSVDGRNATWHGTAGRPTYRAPDLDGSPYVVFAPPSTGDAHSAAAVALATLPIAFGAVTSFVLPQTLLFGVVLAPVAYAVRRHSFTRGPDAIGVWLAAVGVATAIGVTAVYGPTWVPGPSLLAVVIGLAATTDRVRARRWSPRRLAAAAGAAIAVTFVMLVALHAVVGSDGSISSPLQSTALALPLAALLPLGAALAGSGRAAAGWAAITVLAFAAVPSALVDIADPPGGLAAGIMAMLLFGLAVVVPLAGVLVLAVGRTLRTDPPRRKDTERSTEDKLSDNTTY